MSRKSVAGKRVRQEKVKQPKKVSGTDSSFFYESRISRCRVPLDRVNCPPPLGRSTASRTCARMRWQVVVRRSAQRDVPRSGDLGSVEHQVPAGQQVAVTGDVDHTADAGHARVGCVAQVVAADVADDRHRHPGLNQPVRERPGPGRIRAALSDHGEACRGVCRVRRPNFALEPVAAVPSAGPGMNEPSSLEPIGQSLHPGQPERINPVEDVHVGVLSEPGGIGLTAATGVGGSAAGAGPAAATTILVTRRRAKRC